MAAGNKARDVLVEPGHGIGDPDHLSDDPFGVFAVVALRSVRRSR